MNTPLDTAVRLLAEMADLRVLHRDNVLFVTTPARATELEKMTDEEKPQSEDRNEWRLGARGASGRDHECWRCGRDVTPLLRHNGS